MSTLIGSLGEGGGFLRLSPGSQSVYFTSTSEVHMVLQLRVWL